MTRTSDPGGPPNSVKRRLRDQTGFDWDATRQSFLDNTDNIVSLVVQNIVPVSALQATFVMQATFSDGSSLMYRRQGANPFARPEGFIGPMVMTVPLPSGVTMPTHLLSSININFSIANMKALIASTFTFKPPMPKVFT